MPGMRESPHGLVCEYVKYVEQCKVLNETNGKSNEVVSTDRNEFVWRSMPLGFESDCDLNRNVCMNRIGNELCSIRPRVQDEKALQLQRQL